MRQKFTRWLSLLTVCFMLAAYCTTAQAALQAVGPTDPVSTLPAWYQDTTNRALELCVDASGMCVLPPFDLTFTGPITTVGPISDANFPSEIFYFLADTSLAVNGDTAKLRLAMEGSFLGGVKPNGGITFLRINLQKMAGLPPNSTYTVTHPYGTFQFTTDGAGVANNGGGPAAFRTEDLSAGVINYFPPSMQAATNTHMGPFLSSSAGLTVVPGFGTYIGNPLVATTVTGSPTGNNFYRITGPNIGGAGVNTVQTNLFTLSGKVFTGQIPSPMTIDRVTYARDAATGQIDAFVSALPTAIPAISGTGILATNFAQDFPATGKFFAHIPFTTVLPSSLVITNSLDVPPIPHPITLVDEVIITQAFFDPISRNLTIKANSRDKVAPLPTLTATGFGALNPTTGTLVAPLPLNTIPPMDITVSSSKGGSATAPVSIFTPPPAPLAVADTATTAVGTAVTIPVLANDTAVGIINPASVVISTQSLNGVAVASANGTVLFTPAAGFFGTTTFAYTVNDNLLQTSNAATVTVTVTAPPAPVAVVDTAITTAGTAVTIPVLANDTPAGTINPASVVISTQSLNGVAIANPAGTVTFTPAAGFTGSTTFAYTVKDSLLQTSNAATVTVTVTAPATPVAVADAITTAAGTAVVINVLANDTAASIINPASLAISTQSVNGIATANINGTVTFAPAAGFTGTTTFAYTFKDSLLQTSNAAIVTVTVATQAPLAVADTATMVAGGPPLVINVTLNDTVVSPSIIDFASVVISTPSINGTAVANLNGTVTFTPAAGFGGTTTFAYTVKNTLGQVSNPAIVTVTVTGIPPVTNIAPVAANDVASTFVNTPRIINLTANDTDADGTINPATVVIVNQPLNASAFTNNLNGTVTYTSAIAGTDSFTYNVKDNLGAVSNNATVTVSVASAITDSVNVLRAQFTAATGQWLVEGTTTNVAPLSKTVTIYVGNTPDPLKILGTVNTTAADGRWKLQLPAGANLSPAPTNTISVALPSTASRLAFPVAVR